MPGSPPVAVVTDSTASLPADLARQLTVVPLAVVVNGVERDDVAYAAKLVNPYLLRFYFHMAGMPEGEFLRRIRGTRIQDQDPGVRDQLALNPES